MGLYIRKEPKRKPKPLRTGRGILAQILEIKAREAAAEKDLAPGENLLTGGGNVVKFRFKE